MFSRLEIDSDVTVCSSSGWAHGVTASGRKIVYCHAPARWLYQTDRYLGTGTETSSLDMTDRVRLGLQRGGLSLARGRLEKWDLKAALSADQYLVNSTAVATAVQELYGIAAEVLAPPPALGPIGPMQAIDEVEPGFWLCVSRLLRYKHVDAVVEAMRGRPADRLVIVGSGPDRDYLESLGVPRVTFLGAATDAQLRWCYANCRALLIPSFEDFGLTPLEAASFGKPSGALRFGGFLDTIVEGLTGTFIMSPNAAAVLDAMDELSTTRYSAEKLVAHAQRFSEAQFGRRLREVVFEDSKIASPSTNSGTAD
jgi:glycosyltransferase involved in cell wall biosynthesis